MEHEYHLMWQHRWLWRQRQRHLPRPHHGQVGGLQCVTCALNIPLPAWYQHKCSGTRRWPHAALDVQPCNLAQVSWYRQMIKLEPTVRGRRRRWRSRAAALPLGACITAESTRSVRLWWASTAVLTMVTIQTGMQRESKCTTWHAFCLQTSAFGALSCQLWNTQQTAPDACVGAAA